MGPIFYLAAVLFSQQLEVLVIFEKIFVLEFSSNQVNCFFTNVLFHFRLKIFQPSLKVSLRKSIRSNLVRSGQAFAAAISH